MHRGRSQTLDDNDPAGGGREDSISQVETLPDIISLADGEIAVSISPKSPNEGKNKRGGRERLPLTQRF